MMRLAHVDKSNAGVNWPEHFEAHDVQFVVLNLSQDKDLVQTLRRRLGWTVDFEDQESVIFARLCHAKEGSAQK
ncbi:MAG: hypothetical protein JXA21_28160 [Anaerolineae bacterium]|nr:hypothetical protein [Anaerolineae bacterium]